MVREIWPESLISHTCWRVRVTVVGAVNATKIGDFDFIDKFISPFLISVLSWHCCPLVSVESTSERVVTRSVLNR